MVDDLGRLAEMVEAIDPKRIHVATHGVFGLITIAPALIAAARHLQMEHALCSGQRTTLDYGASSVIDSTMGPLPSVKQLRCPGCVVLATLKAKLVKMKMEGSDD